MFRLDFVIINTPEIAGIDANFPSSKNDLMALFCSVYNPSVHTKFEARDTRGIVQYIGTCSTVQSDNFVYIYNVL